MGEKKRSFGSQIVTTSLTGGVSAGREEERIEGILDHIRPGRNLVSGREDVYVPGGQVSIEAEAGRTHAIQEGLDNEVVQENLGVTPTKRGLPPCKRVGLED